MFVLPRRKMTNKCHPLHSSANRPRHLCCSCTEYMFDDERWRGKRSRSTITVCKRWYTHCLLAQIKTEPLSFSVDDLSYSLCSIASPFTPARQSLCARWHMTHRCRFLWIRLCLVVLSTLVYVCEVISRALHSVYPIGCIEYVYLITRVLEMLLRASRSFERLTKSLWSMLCCWFLTNWLSFCFASYVIAD